ncbi:hypothetical protein [Kineococcus radiotolerans]|uniref:ATP/GTP-binding protein n=1 Tax=Kineococcus radiotolerans (strain ATCC BAA-149 / DSM 14245 / SRS30216) TaxID=266940 RepID=A6WH11_KINRD|nr:hypothetical protein [Kineococcus radiotolerans]ABS06100.1 hypothetical protein Krad_4641 [Kineococcus radiotolerans SRS30216 = ATCC BAA-149]
MSAVGRRRGLTAAAALVSTLVVLPSAVADDGVPPVVVSNSHGGVGTTVHQTGTPGGSGKAANGAQTVRARGAGSTCSYNDTVVTSTGGTAVTPAGAGRANENAGTGLVGDSTQGRFVTRFCGGASTVIWVPNGAVAGPAGVPTVTPEMLAQDARNLLPIPVPAYATNGWGPGASLVNMPTWWWVTNASGSLTQRTSLGAVWAEVTATPLTSTWTPNTPTDNPVTCTGMGIAWRDGMSEEQAGHCAVTYTTASFRRLAGADQAFNSQLSVTWRVTWVGSGGTGGTLAPLSMDADIPMQVYERQILNKPPTP